MATQIRSAELLVKNAISSPDIMEELKKNPKETLEKLEKEATNNLPRVLEGDRWIYRIVVASLSLVVLIVVVGVIYIALIPTEGIRDIPDVLTALGSAAIGALAGLLAPSPKGNI